MMGASTNHRVGTPRGQPHSKVISLAKWEGISRVACNLIVCRSDVKTPQTEKYFSYFFRVSYLLVISVR